MAAAVAAEARMTPQARCGTEMRISPRRPHLPPPERHRAPKYANGRRLVAWAPPQQQSPLQPRPPQCMASPTPRRDQRKQRVPQPGPWRGRQPRPQEMAVGVVEIWAVLLWPAHGRWGSPLPSVRTNGRQKGRMLIGSRLSSRQSQWKPQWSLRRCSRPAAMAASACWQPGRPRARRGTQQQSSQPPRPAWQRASVGPLRRAAPHRPRGHRRSRRWRGATQRKAAPMAPWRARWRARERTKTA